MIYRGHVKNGTIVLDGAAQLPENAAVKVEVEEAGEGNDARSDLQPTWAEVFKDLIGKAQGLPADSARNHDHYLYGAPKQ